MILDLLRERLSTIDRFTDESGQLLRHAVTEAAMNMDPEMIKILIADPELKDHFFSEIDDVLVFDKVRFTWVVDSKAFLPDSYTAYKNKIGLVDERGSSLSQARDLSFVWPYKDCILEGGQTKADATHTEVFYNELLAPDQVAKLSSPKLLSNAARYDINGRHTAIDFRDNDNLIIQGNNLLSLYSLLPRFKGQVKLIYIDPPYYFEAKRAEDTFSYNSNFKKSTWLTFMKNRLEVARELLSDDGSIFVQISDDGVAELHLLMKEIFPDQFINKITVKTRSASGFSSVNAGLYETAEYILCFGKDRRQWTYNTQYVKADYDTNYSHYVLNKEDHYSNWSLSKVSEVYANHTGYESAKEMKNSVGDTAFSAGVAKFANENAENVFRYTVINNNASKELQVARDKSKQQPDEIILIERENNYDVYVRNGEEMAFYSKKFQEVDGQLVPTTLLTNMWTDTPYEGIANEGGVTLKGGKKPESLIRRIIELASDPGDIVLDYHLGSGTTAAVAHKLGRRYIGCEQLDYGKHSAVTRLQKVIAGDKTGISKVVGWKGGGSFVFCELADHNEKTIAKAQSAADSETLLAVIDELVERGELRPEVLPDSLEKHRDDFLELEFFDQKRVVLDLINKDRLYIAFADRDDTAYEVRDDDRAFSVNFYQGLTQ